LERELLANPGSERSYVFNFEKPYRFKALRQIGGRLTDAEYWNARAE
jgi:hypothetical protein